MCLFSTLDYGPLLSMNNHSFTRLTHVGQGALHRERHLSSIKHYQLDDDLRQAYFESYCISFLARVNPPPVLEQCSGSRKLGILLGRSPAWTAEMWGPDTSSNHSPWNNSICLKVEMSFRLSHSVHEVTFPNETFISSSILWCLRRI